MSRAHPYSHDSDLVNSLRNFKMTELDRLGEDHPKRRPHEFGWTSHHPLEQKLALESLSCKPRHLN